jgi:hypothetical protein
MSEKSAEFWGILELMGHVRMAGRISEEERFGAKIGRIDCPTQADQFITVFFGGGSIYRLTPCTEEVAREVAKNSIPQPIHSYEMPRAALNYSERQSQRTAEDYEFDDR